MRGAADREIHRDDRRSGRHDDGSVDFADRSSAIAAIKIAIADADVSHSDKFSDLINYATVPWLLIE